VIYLVPFTGVGFLLLNQIRRKEIPGTSTVKTPTVPSRGGPESVFRGFQRICEQFAGVPWIHFCDGYFEVHLFI